MFAKLLKHEWRATRGIIGLLCVIILVSGLTIGGVMNYMIGVESAGEVVVMDEASATFEPMSDLAEVVCVLLVVAGIMAIAVCGAGSVFFVIYRFYKRHFTDEGYLTYTLPVTNHQLLLSSYLNSVIGVLLVMLACFAAVCIAVALVLLAFPENIIWADVMVSLKEAWAQILESLRQNAGEFALAAFSAIVSAASELMVLMLAVTIGALIAKKHKVLAAVAVYYGISMVQSFIYATTTVSTNVVTENVTWFLGTPGVLSLAVGIGGYFLMHYLTNKKLNLA